MEDEEVRKGREDEKLGRMKRRREVGGGRWEVRMEALYTQSQLHSQMEGTGSAAAGMPDTFAVQAQSSRDTYSARRCSLIGGV